MQLAASGTSSLVRGLALATALAAAAARPSLSDAMFLLGRHAATDADPARLAALDSRSADLQVALDDLLACPEGNQAARRDTVLDAVLPLWTTMPKSRHGRIDWRSLRYIGNRYFVSRYSIRVKGLEPTRLVNATSAHGFAVLSQRAPAFAEMLLNESLAHGGVFSLEDVVAVVTALEQVVFDTERSHLEAMYRRKGLTPQHTVDRATLQQMLKEFLVFTMAEEEEELALALLSSEANMDENVPGWRSAWAWMDGSVRAAEFTRWRDPSTALNFQGRHSFEEALDLVKGIHKSFAAFWEAQCHTIKDALVGMDTHGTGRVSLGGFYAANKAGEWRFGESESYLRELGALDESSPARGEQVIITNYMQSISNCIIIRPNYMVCCTNTCEGILGDLEAALGTPAAEPEAILELVGNMTTDDDDPILIDEPLREQLMKVAQSHGGKVPLHGRLFAQWLHYVFPLDCAFPRTPEAAEVPSPKDYGDLHAILPEEVEMLVAQGVIRMDTGPVAVNMSERMTQWTEEEDLPYDDALAAPALEDLKLQAWGSAAILAMSVVGTLWATTDKPEKPNGPDGSTHDI